MKITKQQLRRIIKEEKAKLMSEVSPADMGMAAASMDSQKRDQINTNIEVPVELFDQLVEYLDDMSGLKLRGSGFIASRARELLLKLERETGVL